MALEARLKELHKATKKHTTDLAGLKKLLEDGGKKEKKEIEATLGRMIVRTETMWQNLRALGRTLKKESK